MRFSSTITSSLHYSPMEKKASLSLFPSLLLLLVLDACSALAHPARQNVTSYHSHLYPGFYSHSCPDAEEIVLHFVFNAALMDPGIIPGIIRLYFHDCFVQGCDASLLLDETPSGEEVEKDWPGNGSSLRGLEVIDEIKQQLEESCPGTVSCADVLAFAARDAAVIAGLPRYQINSGRRDGRISLASTCTGHLPSPYSSVHNLTSIFASKGFSQEELVVLSGAHSIGRAHCSSFDARLQTQELNGDYMDQDPTLDPAYAFYLRAMCPKKGQPWWLGGDLDPTGLFSGAAHLDSLTPGILDNAYYVGLKMGKGLLASDQALMNDPVTSELVNKYALHGEVWRVKFGRAMKKVGNFGVLTGDEGEIRRDCRRVN